MTLITDVREEIYQLFKTNWTFTPYRFENENEKSAYAGSVSWVRLTVRNLAGAQETLGPKPHRKYVRAGMIIVQVFTPMNTGMSQAGTLAEAAKAIFEGESFSGIWCQNARIRDTGNDGKWQQTSVEVDIVYFETK